MTSQSSYQMTTTLPLLNKFHPRLRPVFHTNQNLTGKAVLGNEQPNQVDMLQSHHALLRPFNVDLLPATQYIPNRIFLNLLLLGHPIFFLNNATFLLCLEFSNLVNSPFSFLIYLSCHHQSITVLSFLPLQCPPQVDEFKLNR